jgi:hypothetical protein
MNELSKIIKSLKGSDVKFIEKRLKDKPKISSLLQVIIQFPDQLDEYYAKELGYFERPGSFLTLKSRFIDAISIAIIEKDTNPIANVHSRVYRIKSFMFETYELILEEDIKRTLNQARKYELYHSICELLKLKTILLKRSFESQKKIDKLNSEILKIEALRDGLEAIENQFFTYLFTDNINPFNSLDRERFYSLPITDRAFSELKKNSKTIFFLAESMDIDCCLKMSSPKSKNLIQRIDNLEKFYSESFLKIKYPFALIGIETMRHKYYRRYGERDFSDQTFEKILKMLPFVAYKPMYISVMIYALYVSYQQLALVKTNENTRTKEFVNQCSQSEHELILLTNFYCNACYLYNFGEYSNALKNIAKARQLVSNSIRTNSDTPAELAMLSLLILCQQNELSTKMIEYELNTLRYLFSIRKFSHKKLIEDFMNLCKKILNGYLFKDGETHDIKLKLIVATLQEKGFVVLINNG